MNEQIYQNSYLVEYDQSCGENLKNSQLATLIHDNFINMTQPEMLMFINKILGENEIRKTLLKYELLHYQPNKITSFQDFQKKATHYLTKYSKRVCNIILEDSIWIMHNTTDVFPIRDNEIIFENTMSNKAKCDQEFLSFLKNITNFLNKLCNQVKCSYTLYDEKDITLVLIKCKFIID
jgi:hypothetical protein